MELELTRLDEKTIDRYAKFLLEKGKITDSLTAGIILNNGNLIIIVYNFESGLAHCPDTCDYAVITKDNIFIANEKETYDIVNKVVKVSKYELPDGYDLADFWVDNDDEDKYENNMRKKYGFPEW